MSLLQWVKAHASELQSFNSKTLLRMTFNPLHGGIHKFPRTKHISSHQEKHGKSGRKIVVCRNQSQTNSERCPIS